MEDIVKRVIFFALATLSLVPSAFGHDAGENPLFLGPGKWAAGREDWVQPQVVASTVCHNVKQRVETPKGHFVYRTRKICAPN
jgi:hypothetical protein